jgi:hypothetical protein
MRVKTKKRIAVGSIAAVAVIGILVAAAISGAFDSEEQQPALEISSSSSAAASSSSSDSDLDDLEWFSALGTGKDFAENILNSTWSSDRSEMKVTFNHKGKMTIYRDGDDPETHSIKLSDVSNPDGGIYGTAAMTVDGKDSYVVNVSTKTATDQTPVLTCSLIDDQKLTKVTNSDTFTVTGPSLAGWTDFLGPTKTVDFEKQLRNWCAKKVPMASSASWYGSYTVFPKQKTVESKFTLNNSAQTVVYADRDKAGKWIFTLESDYKSVDGSDE